MTGLRSRRAAVLASALWTLWLLLSAVALVHVSPTSDAGSGLLLLGYATVGAILAARRPYNAVGWIMLALALTFACQVAGVAYVWTGTNPVLGVVAWFSGWAWSVWLGLIGIFLPLLFPDGRLLSARWRPFLWVGGAAVLTGAATAALRPGRLDIAAPVSVRNPLGVGAVPAEVFTALEALATALYVLAISGAAVSLLLRLRRAHGAERQQIKWFVFAGVPTLAGLMLGVLSETELRGQLGQDLGVAGYITFTAGALVGIPVGIGIAMFRYRLFDIDLVINRTLVYGALTATLLVTYVGSVLLLNFLLSPLAGGSDLAIACSTLAAAALFRPARRRIQDLVDRRFYRRRYDATRTLGAFSHRLRHELDLDTVGNDLCTVARDTVQPVHVSLWIRP